MSKVKTAQLSGAALDWAVAKAEKRLGKSSPEVLWDYLPDNYFNIVLIGHQCFTRDDDGESVPYTPSEDWAQGGPIIERERIRVIPWDRPVGVRMHGEWYAGIYDSFGMNGPTPLVAAMRCFVASKLGGGVEVPDELVTL